MISISEFTKTSSKLLTGLGKLQRKTNIYVFLQILFIILVSRTSRTPAPVSTKWPHKNQAGEDIFIISQNIFFNQLMFHN